MHASRLPTQGAETIAVIIDESSPGELAPILRVAYALTRQEQKLTTLVCRGASKLEIAVRLRIMANTVQEVMNVAVGVRS